MYSFSDLQNSLRTGNPVLMRFVVENSTQGLIDNIRSFSLPVDERDFNELKMREIACNSSLEEFTRIFDTNIMPTGDDETASLWLSELGRTNQNKWRWPALDNYYKKYWEMCNGKNVDENSTDLVRGWLLADYFALAGNVLYIIVLLLLIIYIIKKIRTNA